MDAYQHTYPLREDLYDASIPNGPAPGLDREFEERNTFSNPISERWSLLNLLVLNFGFHNAHHRRPSQPWHRLPAQHRELYSESNDQVLMPRETRSSFVRYRRDRILNEDLPDIGVKRGSAKDFIGVTVEYLRTPSPADSWHHRRCLVILWFVKIRQCEVPQYS